MQRSNLMILKELLLDLAFFVIGIIAMTQLYAHNIVVLLIMVAMWVIGIIFWHTRHDIIFFVVSAIIGATTEIIVIPFGTWHYANPSFLNIPIWLPFAWGIALMLAKRVAEVIIRVEQR